MQFYKGTHMKTISRKFAQAAFVATLLSASVAMAGFRSFAPVSIVDSSMLAQGDLGYVYNSSDPVEFIGCQVYGDGGDPMALCVARNTNDGLRACTTIDPGQIATIRTLREDSRLTFSWFDTGDCSFVSVWNESDTQPR